MFFKFLGAFYLGLSGLLFVGLMFLVLPFFLLAIMLLPQPYAHRTALFILRVWAFLFSLFSGFWVKTSNKSAVNQSRPHIYVLNHGSFLDAIAVCLTIPQSFYALGKKEMIKIPVFGSIYKRIVVMIDRSSKESRSESLEHLKKILARGESILIFPEGTMNKTTEVLAPFYDGAFKLAKEMNYTIQPLILHNNRKLLPRDKPLNAHPGFIKAEFLNPIEPTQFKDLSTEELKAQVFEQMKSALLRQL